MRKLTTILLLMLTTVTAMAGDATTDTLDVAPQRSAKVPPVVHSAVGDSSQGVEGRLRIVNIAKFQQYSWSERGTLDTDIYSPKSVVFSPDGRDLYVNSLEGCRSVVYSLDSLAKRAVIHYSYDSGDGPLWAPPSSFYTFTHYSDGRTRPFGGKPVECAWSHRGRYLWVTFYRRTFDINAQDPSAVAVIDTRTDSVVRLMDTGPLPKMIAASHDGRTMAVTHWGDNTVGLIDISSDDPARWHHKALVEVGHRLQLNYPLDRSVDRDRNSGYLLRGTIFTPDDRRLLVSGMAGPLTIIDVDRGEVAVEVSNLYGLRHLAIAEGMVYGTCNVAGTVTRVPLDSLMSALDRGVSAGKRSVSTGGVEVCRVGRGARTLSLTPDGKYIFVACNSASSVNVVDAGTMRVVDSIRVDSYPVGLAISPDGTLMAVTSQGRELQGGNAVNIFEISRPDTPPFRPVAESDSIQPSDNIIPAGSENSSGPPLHGRRRIYVAAVLVLAIAALIVVVLRRRR